MAFRIANKAEAFSLAPTGKGSKRVKAPDYLDFIRALPCIVTRRTPVEAAHVSYAAPEYGKLGRGKGAKESDRWAVPLHADEHRRQHGMSERAYWTEVGINPCIVAMALWGAYPNESLALLVINSIKATPPHLVALVGPGGGLYATNQDEDADYGE